MKKFTYIALALLLTSVGASAQYRAIPVEPGSKGELPAAPALPGLSADQFRGLELYSVENYGGRDIRAILRFPSAESLGGEYYTVERRGHNDGEWEVWSNVNYFTNEEEPVKVESYYMSAGPYLYYQDTDFRLVMHGGPMDGYRSNEVTAIFPGANVATQTKGYSATFYSNMMGVGDTYGTGFSAMAQAEGVESRYSEDDGYFLYQWYRRNPNNYAMTAIGGATQATYVPTMDDLGYELVLETRGDDEHCSFLLRYSFGIVRLRVQMSPAYFGNDGFVINTDYVMPASLEKKLYEFDWADEDNQDPIETYGVTVEERQPGQYAFHWPAYNDFERDRGGSTLYFTDNAPYFLASCIQYANRDPEFTGGLPSPAYYGLKNIQVSPMNENYEAIPVTIDILGPDIDGNLTLKWSKELPADGSETEATFICGYYTFLDGTYLYEEGDYFIKARATDTTLDTYWNKDQLWTVTWTDVTPVNQEYLEANGSIFYLVVQSAPAPLTGNGSIEGSVTETQEQTAEAARRVRAAAEGDAATGYAIYLKQKDGGVVAMTTTDDSGHFRFENVPYGRYAVLVNIEGYTQEVVTEVTISESRSNATDVNYYVNADGTITAPQATTAITNATATTSAGEYFSIDGRRLSARPSRPGIYILDGVKVVVR